VNSQRLHDIYSTLLDYFGPQDWWPGETRIEIMVGAILTQAVAWKNVEKSISALKHAGVLNLHQLAQISETELAELIHSTLYHGQKAKKIKALVQYVEQTYSGDIDLMMQQPLLNLRRELLSVWGIGEETADSILLYAGDFPIFVVDAYTRRIFSRVGLTAPDSTYAKVQSFVHRNMTPDPYIYNEFHALLVALGANRCKKTKPMCETCPISQKCKKLQVGQENCDSR
jgi:endonuclease-3 related protein